MREDWLGFRAKCSETGILACTARDGPERRLVKAQNPAGGSALRYRVPRRKYLAGRTIQVFQTAQLLPKARRPLVEYGPFASAWVNVDCNEVARHLDLVETDTSDTCYLAVYARMVMAKEADQGPQAIY